MGGTWINIRVFPTPSERRQTSSDNDTRNALPHSFPPFERSHLSKSIPKPCVDAPLCGLQNLKASLRYNELGPTAGVIARKEYL